MKNCSLFPDLERKEKRADYMKDYIRDYYKKYPEKNREHVRKWKKTKHYTQINRGGRQVIMEWKESIIYFLVNRDGWNCARCGKPIDYLEASIDHRIDVSLGGKNRIENFQLSHRFCNYSANGKAGKGKKHRSWKPKVKEQLKLPKIEEATA
jgi:5-methylcytosine-specific restriction endonuclease McrA